MKIYFDTTGLTGQTDSPFMKVETDGIVIEPNDNSCRYRAIMGENTLSIYFSLPEHIDIPIGSYAMFDGQKYTLNSPQNIKKNGESNIEYTLTLGGAQECLKKYKFRNTSELPKDWKQGDPEPNMTLKFPYTAKPQEHLEMLVKNMNMRSDSKQRWLVGDFVESLGKIISYNHNSCMDALQSIATEFETEWEVVSHIDGKGNEINTIHLRKVEYFKEKGEPLPMSYGRGKGFKPGVGRSNYNDSKPVEKLFVQGGERNIDSSVYGSKELLLPKNKKLKYNGKHFMYPTSTDCEYEEFTEEDGFREYKTDQFGYYVQRADKELKTYEEDSLDLSHIYPSYVGTISWVDEEDPRIMKDESAQFKSIDFDKARIKGEKITVIFQSGMLTGKEFDLWQSDTKLNGYDRNTGKFTIEYADIDGKTMPEKDGFKPKATVYDKDGKIKEEGDKFAFFGMMPQEYACNDSSHSGASWDMLREAVKYMYENENPRFSFTGQVDGIWARKNWINIKGKSVKDYMKPGAYIEFSDHQFFPEGAPIRIMNIKEYVNKPYYPEVELSNVTAASEFWSAMRKIDSTEVVVENKHKESINFTKRNYRTTQELIDSVSGVTDEFEQNLMNALIFEGMVFRAGAKALQYRFVQDNWIETATLPINTDSGNKVIVTKPIRIEHATLDETKKLYWRTAKAFTSRTMEEDEKVYYLYLRCTKTFINIEGRDVGEAEFILSPDKIKINDVEGHYMLWVGFFDKLKDGERNWQPMYGITEMTPGEITGDLLRSSDGKSYFNMIGNALRLSNRLKKEVTEKDPDEQTLSWEDGLLTATNMTIKNALNVIEEALVAGFYFSNEKIRSKTTTEYKPERIQEHKPEDNSKGHKPRMILDGNNGSIVLNSKNKSWREDGKDDEILETISINSYYDSGMIETRSNYDVSYMSSQGIFSNRAGTDALPGSSGLSMKGAIVGLGFGKMDKTYWGSNMGVVGVYGHADNSSSNPAPAYGGWFNVLKANGLCLSTRRVAGNTELYRTDCHIACYNDKHITIRLPLNPYDGQVIMLRQMFSSGFTIVGKVGYKGYNINISGQDYESVSNKNGRGDTTVLIFDGQCWCFNYWIR